MESDWASTEINEVLQLLSSKVDAADVPLKNYISTDNMVPGFGGIVLANNKPLTGKVSAFQKDDILFSNIRTYFRKLWYSNRSGACSNDVLVFRVKKKIYSKFAYYILMSDDFIEYTVKTSKGTKMPRGDKAAIEKYSFKLPSYQEQKSIANILGKLDEKIELNRQMNITLEAMAQALFKSWFVDFDPVIDNALAAGTPIPEPLQARAEIRKVLGDQRKPLPDDLQKQFPDRFVLTDEMGWVPDGCLPEKLSSQIDVLNGFAFKSSDYSEKGTFVLRTKNFNSSNMVELLSDDVYLPESFLETHAKYLCEPYDYHLIMVGASVGNRGLILPHQLPALRNQNMWCFRPNKESHVSKAFTKYLLDNIIVEKIGLASGSAREFFRKGDFQNHYVLFGSKSIQDSFSKLCYPLMNKIAENSAQSEKLALARDMLLPKLLSGELEVPEAESIIDKHLAEA